MKLHSKYAAQIRVNEIGMEGQEKLRGSSVLIVGCGALGSPVAMYLGGAGVGNIFIADFDTVDISNLHRQVFYNECMLGEKKIECLKKSVQNLNHDVTVKTFDNLVTEKVLETLDMNIDLIIDAADNPSTTYLIDRHCVNKKIPYCTAGVSGWTAQVFCYYPGSVSYEDFIPFPDGNLNVLPCSMEGIMGPTAAFAASIQSSLAIKILTGRQDPKSSFLIADLYNMKFDTIY